MVGTICLAGRGARRKRQFIGDCVVFAVTAVLAGGLVGVVGAMIGRAISKLPAGQHMLLSAVIIALGLLLVESVIQNRVRPFGPHRQVSPETLLRHGLRGAALRWGFELGLGVSTRINSWALWAALLGVAWLGDPIAGLMVGGLYGLARGMQPLATAHSRERDVGWLTARVKAIKGRERLSGAIGIVALAGILMSATL